MCECAVKNLDEARHFDLVLGKQIGLKSLVHGMRIFLFLLLIAILILSYGYWHASTQGSVNISLYNFSEENTYKLLNDTKIVLRSETGEVLATGKTEFIYSTAYLSHPTEGSCY